MTWWLRTDKCGFKLEPLLQQLLSCKSHSFYVCLLSSLSFPCLLFLCFRRVLLGRPPASGYLPEDPESERTAAAKSAEQALPSAPQAYYTAPVLANPDYQRHVANTGVESGVFESKEQGGHSQSQGQGHDPSQWKSSSVPLRSETDSSLPVVIALYDHEVSCCCWSFSLRTLHFTYCGRWLSFWTLCMTVSLPPSSYTVQFFRLMLTTSWTFLREITLRSVASRLSEVPLRNL